MSIRSAHNGMKHAFKYICSVIVLLILSLSVSEAFGQKSKLVQGGVINGVPYASTDFENINLTNGALNLNFPLASLQGRGQTGFGYNLRYNSKLWSSVTNPVYNQHYVPNPTYQNYLAEGDDAGWQDSDSVEINVVNRASTLDWPGGNPCDSGVQWLLAYKWRVEVDFPDGRKVEFRPTGYSDLYPGQTDNGGYFNVDPQGRVYSTSCTNPGVSSPSYSRMVYYSSDGSAMRLTFANGEPLGFVWEISMPDGSRIVEPVGGGQRIIDKNGNFVERQTVTLPDGTQLPGWRDEVGRYIARKKDFAENEDRYYQLGFNGDLLTWKVKWKNVYVLKPYTTTCNTCGNERGPVQDEFASMEFRVVESIELPGELGLYTFEYHAKNQSDSSISPGWGEIKSVTLPTAAKVSYGYKLSALQPSEGEDAPLPGEINLRVDQILARAGTLNKKRLTYSDLYDGQSTSKEDVWSYSISRTGSSVVAPDGSTSSQVFWDIVNDQQKGGQVYKETRPDGTIIERVWANNAPVEFVFGAGNHLNAYVKTEFVTIPDANGSPSLTAIKDFTYDRNQNLLEVAEYEWIPAASPSILRNPSGIVVGFTGLTPIRTSATTYYNPTPPDESPSSSTNAYYQSSAPALRNLSAATEVKANGLTVAARTEIFYDGASAPIKGNPSTITTWDSHKSGTYQPYNGSPLTPANSVSVLTQYDQFGNPVLVTDAKGCQTEITYGPINGFAGLYPTQTKTALGTPIQRTSTAAYDFYTGLVTIATDVDNNISTVMEYDPLGRPTKIRTAAGTPLESWTTTDYYDIGRYIVVKSDLETKGDGKKVATRFYDQLGRVRLSKTLENAATQSATNETDGIKVQSRYKTVSGYVYQLASNPYRADYPANETDAAMGWTLSTAWSSGMRSEVQTFAGAGLPTAFGGSNTNSTGIVTTDIDADRTLVTDQAGKQRISRTNAVGQLKDVWEVTASGADTEAITFGNPAVNLHGYKTSYSYDTLNNLTTVNQGVQTRSFTYSSLSRLIGATNPESGLIQYQYDNNGNLTSKTDARNITTSYVYDALNRVTNRNYTNEPTGSETPDVSYYYDNLPNAKGKLIKVQSSVSTTEYTAFDILGRVTGHKQTTDGTAYTTGYVYNLSGTLIEETYPSGRVVKNTLETDGDLMQVQSRKPNDTFRNYANAFQYNAAGAVTAMRLGNGKWETTQFNSRLQPIQIGLGASAASTNLLKLNYDYGTTQNNGNVLSQTITVPTVGSNPGFTAVQTYTYDSLNRLKDADEKPSGWTQANCDSDPTKCWKQTFVFDRYGNRTFDTSANRTTTIPTNCPAAVCNPSANAADNLLKTSDGYVFDNVGNTTKDAELRKFTYDGENKQVKVETVDASGGNPTGTIGEYFYDGDGKRVKKYVPSTGETTIFVHDAAGKLVAEYSTIVEPPATAKVAYLTNDHLGSPRINTDRDGAVIARHDYHPFGEEVSTSQRTSSLGYADDTVRKQFTGYERDTESSLDYAQARYYGNSLGRFRSPDPLYIEFRRLPFPQAWNLYTYTRNNPLVFTDPDGLEVAVNCKTTKEQTKACQEQATSNLNNRKDAQFTVEIKNGKLAIVGKVDVSKLSKSEKKLYTAITDSFGKATLNVEMSSDKITFGRFDGAGQNSIDLADLSKLNGVDKTLAGEVIAHEAIEGFESSLGLDDRDNPGALFSESHATANQFFGAASITVPDASDLAGARVSGREVIYNFGRLGTSVNVTKKFKTPVPIASITSANFPNLVGDINKVRPNAPTQAPTKPREKP